MFRRPIYKSEIDNRVFVDSKLKDSDYVKSFSFEWTEIDGFIGKETLSYGHIFGRFLFTESSNKSLTSSKIFTLPKTPYPIVLSSV